jgi:hypothetical protein
MKSLQKALSISVPILLAVIVFLVGLDDFLSRIMGLEGARFQVWFDVVSNLLFLFVLLTVVVWAATWLRKS